MYPTLFKFGGLVIHTYGLFMALAFLTGIVLASSRAYRYDLSRDFVLDLGFWVLLAGIVGARFLDVLTNIEYYKLDLWKMVKIWEGGLSFFGGLTGGLLGGIGYCRLKKVPVFQAGDLIAPYIALGQSLGRLGCFFAGCCYGRACDLFFSVTFNNPETLAPRGIPLYPIQIVESLADFVVFLVLATIANRRSFTGQIFSLYFILYPAVRFIAEFYRGDNPAVFMNLTLYQLISIVVLIAGLILYVYLWKKQKSAEEK